MVVTNRYSLRGHEVYPYPGNASGTYSVEIILPCVFATSEENVRAWFRSQHPRAHIDSVRLIQPNVDACYGVTIEYLLSRLPIFRVL